MRTFLDCLLGYGDVSRIRIAIFIVVIIVGTYLIFTVYPYFRSKYAFVKNIGEYCIIGCGRDSCKKLGNAGRGNNYHDTQDASTPAQTGCMMTGWELSHFITHIFVGYYLNMYYSTALSVGYELYEYKTCDCHSGFDIVYNTAGGIVGTYIKYALQ